ncbi:MAG: hypothetical protein JST16_11435 [Bdellovibrionales bacterium]|nr:hypothetical protein [Bdellovibrionales bacterium]
MKTLMALATFIGALAAHASSPYCDEESTCFVSMSDCSAGGLAWGPLGYYALPRPTYVATSMRASSYATVTVRSHMVCVAQNGTLARYSKNSTREVSMGQGALVSLGREYTVSYDDVSVTNIRDVAPEAIQAAEQAAIESCKRKFDSVREGQIQSLGGVCK